MTGGTLPPDIAVDPKGWLSHRFEVERARLLRGKKRGWWLIPVRTQHAFFDELRKRGIIPEALSGENAAAVMRERRRRAKGKPCPRCGAFCRDAPHFRVGFEPGRRRRAPECAGSLRRNSRQATAPAAVPLAGSPAPVDQGEDPAALIPERVRAAGRRAV